MSYGTGRYVVRAQNRSDTYRFSNKRAAEQFARTLAVENMKASVYDHRLGAHWPIATFVRESSGRVTRVAT